MLTQRDAFTKLLKMDEVQKDVEMVQFLNHRIDMLNAKNTSSKGSLTKTQKENEVLKGKILAKMEVETSYSATEIGHLFDITCQKASALLKQLVEVGSITRLEEKGTSKFKKVFQVD